MTLASSFYKASRGVGNRIYDFFSFATGQNALDKRGLSRPNGGTTASQTGSFLALGATIIGAVLVPVVGPLALVFAGAAGTVASVAPLTLQSAYLIGKNDAAKKKTKKAPKAG